jgi:predicted nucleotidyltransferase
VPAPVETELRVTQAGSWFVVRTADHDFRGVLPELAYPLSGDEFARRFAADTPDLDRIYGNFERHIVELLDQTARRRAVPWEQALVELSERLDRSGVAWFLCGSTALAVRGIDVEPRDVDLVTEDHAAVVEALGNALIEPVSRDSERTWVAEWFGRAYLGARVEWIAGVYPEVDEGSSQNEIGPEAASRLERVDWNGRVLLLTPLDLQLAVSAQRGLRGRVEAIQAFSRRSTQR